MSEMMLWLLLLNIVEAKKEGKQIDGFRRKLMIPQSEILEYPEYEVKSKIENIFVNEKMLEKYSVKIYEIGPYFYEHYQKKYKLMKMDVNTFRIDVYFFECPLAVEIDKKGHTDRDLIFEEKIQEELDQKLACKSIRINASKRYDDDYEIGRIQTFISKFKNRLLRKLEKESNKKVKELKDEIKSKNLNWQSTLPNKNKVFKIFC